MAYSTRKSGPTPSSGSTTQPELRTSSSTTTRTYSSAAPAGYHYMPDGSLMLDSDMPKSNGAAAVDTRTIIDGEVINPRPLPPKNSTLVESDFLGQTPIPVLLANTTSVFVDFETEVIPSSVATDICFLTSMSQRYLFNKPQLFEGSEDEEDAYSTILNYFLPSVGGLRDFRVGGNAGVAYALVVKDKTNTKFYDWENEIFDNGYTQYEGFVGGDLIPVEFPVVSANTDYCVYIVSSGGLCYDMPTEQLPWNINQLVDITTTINFHNEDASKFTVGDAKVITARPRAILNSQGSIDIDIQVTRVGDALFEFAVDRKDLYGTGEHDVSVGFNNIVAGESGLPEIINIDLFASLNNAGTIGSIKGTITLGESTLQNATLEFQPSNFFKIRS